MPREPRVPDTAFNVTLWPYRPMNRERVFRNALDNEIMFSIKKTRALRGGLTITPGAVLKKMERVPQ